MKIRFVRDVSLRAVELQGTDSEPVGYIWNGGKQIPLTDVVLTYRVAKAFAVFWESAEESAEIEW